MEEELEEVDEELEEELLELEELEEDLEEELAEEIPRTSSLRRLKRTAACPRVSGSSGPKCVLSYPLMIPRLYISPIASSAK